MTWHCRLFADPAFTSLSCEAIVSLRVNMLGCRLRMHSDETVAHVAGAQNCTALLCTRVGRRGTMQGIGKDLHMLQDEFVSLEFVKFCHYML